MWKSHTFQRRDEPSDEGVPSLLGRRRADSEDVEVLDESVEEVSCPWCGNGNAIEVIDDGAPGDGVAPPPPLSDPEFVAGLRPIPSGGLGVEMARPAPDIAGTNPAGSPVGIRMDELAGAVLVAFLHLECDGCEESRAAARDRSRAELPAGTSVAIVTKGLALSPLMTSVERRRASAESRSS